MQKIEINRLGPVTHCELEINNFTVFTGPQASGKSTVAKSIFFFKNFKNILLDEVRRYSLLRTVQREEKMNLGLRQRTEKAVRSNFLQTFGSTWHMDMSMFIAYHFSQDIFVKVSLKEDLTSPNYIWIDFSDKLKSFIYSLENLISGSAFKPSEEELFSVKGRIHDFFDDDAEIVYIPAGRSMITLLSTQLNYIYSSMDDMQKKNMDYCTQNYLERILRLKPSFSLSISQMIQEKIHLTDIRLNRDLLRMAGELMRSILQGEYRNVDGEERLIVPDRSSDGADPAETGFESVDWSRGHKYVKINFASSGQQEVVWILNVIFYYLLNNTKAYFIIEEPESHLFPNAQKLIAEFIALARYEGRNQILITTHSPYILGAVNNLLYARYISEKVDGAELEKIIPHGKWLAYEDVSAYFIDRGQVAACMDREFPVIENEVIDGASEDINRDYDRMVLLKEKSVRGEAL